MISPGPDRSGRRTRLVLSAAFTGVLGAVAVIYGIVTDRTASVVVGTLLLLVTLYTLAVLRRLVRHGGS